MARRLPTVVMTSAVSAILVGYEGQAEAIALAVNSLRAQTHSPSQILCVDQSPDGRFGRVLAPHADVEVLTLGENLGYSSACNRAARRATADYVMFLNPDAVADPDCVDELARVLDARPNAAIAGAQVLLPGARSVNAGDNVLHLSGLSWAGRYGRPVEHGAPRPAAVVSGAALMVRRSVFETLGGYTEGFFMYYDDVDLAWRARLEGWDVMFCPLAKVVHDYEFVKGGYKWRYLERNRWWCMLAHLELRSLLALAPLLAAVEVAIWLRAGAEGWVAAKREAWRVLWNDRQALRTRRRAIQASRRVGDRIILERMSAEVDSPFLASPVLRVAQPLLRAYRRMVLALVATDR